MTSPPKTSDAPVRRLGLPLLLAAAVVGASGAMFVPVRPLVPPGARAWNRTVVVSGRRRHELIVAPRRGTAGRPLLVVLHGSDATPAFEERRTGLAPLAGEGRAVLAYPAGVGESWNAGGGCCGAAASRGVDDVAFLRAVVADAVDRLGVDPRRVYLVGYSNGGKLALRMLAADPRPWAGVAVFGAVPTVPLGPGGAPVPVLLAGGTADGRTPWSAIVAAAEHLGRGATTRTELAGGRVAVTTWAGGGDGRGRVRLVAYKGWGHEWPEARDAPLPLAALIEELSAT